MFPPSSTAYLQTGFRTPELYTVLVVAVLHLGSKADDRSITIFYYCTARAPSARARARRRARETPSARSRRR